MRVALYARYSTDLQDRTSIAGQYRNCEALAEQHGFAIAARFADEGISGTDDQRPGYRAMLAALERREFDGIVVDETSRLTRNPWELPRLMEELAFRGQFVLAKGFDSRQESAHLLAGIYGGIDRLELQKIKARTHRGLRERHTAGFSAGGKTYGYTSVPTDPTDPDTRWRKVIDPETARWVLWIFERYAGGSGAKAIAAELNRLGVPSPGATWKRARRRNDGKWQHSALLGSASRGGGILRNELYIGRVVWNRCEWIKRPGTSKRAYRLRPPEEWLIEEQPELRIVPSALWEQVQMRLRNARSGGAHQGRKPVYLLSGILKCAHCGGSLTMVDTRCYGCGTRHRGGDAACDNALRLPRLQLEDRFLAGVQNELLSDDWVQWAQRQIKRRLETPVDDLAAARRELVDVEGRLRRLVDAIADAGFSSALKAKLAELERRQDELQSAIAASSKPKRPPSLKAIAARWRAAIEDLANLPKTASGTELDQARASLRTVLGEVRVDRRGVARADVVLPAYKLVAGAGFEPATFGL